jgi:hypothetical protein
VHDDRELARDSRAGFEDTSVTSTLLYLTNFAKIQSKLRSRAMKFY